MSENAGFDVAGAAAGTNNESAGEAGPVADGNILGGGGEQQGNGNPAWQPFLDVLPTSLHGTVTPVLKDWDRGVQQRFQQIHQQYEPYKAYQDLIDNEIGMDSIVPALQLLQQLNEDPRQIYDALGQHFNYGNVEPELEDPETDGFRDPRIDDLEAGFRQLAEIQLNNNRISEEQQADSDLEDMLAQARETHGDFNERIVLGLMLSGMDIDTAIQEYQANNNSVLEASKRPPAPNVMSRGGVPNVGAVDTSKMSGKDRRGLVAGMLQRAAQSDQ